MFAGNPDKCALSETGERYVEDYMRFMREKGVQFDKSSTDKSRFKGLQAKYGSERVATRLTIVSREPGEFSPCLYDVWRFEQRDPRFGKADYPWGLIAGQIVQNLLHYYTDPKDLVLDPMAGSGTTLDVCRAMDRRCLAYDLAPARSDIQPHDLAEGPPPISELVQLVVLDPPYFTMKQENAYASYAQYLGFLEAIIRHTVPTLRPGGYVALVLMDQVNKDGKKFALIGPAYQFLGQMGCQYEHLIGLPLSSQQFQGYDVTHAREAKTLLGLNRQMWIFRRPLNGP